MAEAFACGGQWVHFSNGAVESLLACWERLAKGRADEPGMGTLAAYLRQLIDHSGPGARSFGMNRELLPDELSSPPESAALLKVVEETAADPTLVSGVNWSCELVADWQERLIQMTETLRAAVAPEQTS